MNPEMQKRLYEMEVTPPQAVWEKLSLNIDEINEDNRVAKKVLHSELMPPASVWKKIDSIINVVEEKISVRKAPVINFRRLSVAAVFIAVIITGWVLIRNNSSNKTGLVETENPASKENLISTNTSANKTEVIIPDNAQIDQSISTTDASTSNIIVSNTSPIQVFKNGKKNNLPSSKNDLSIQPTSVQFASLNEPLEKSFNEPIDDLSLVTSNQNYFTMVNANGRLVKIPAELASLVPHLQDKPVSEDYYEVMFGEGAYWKETLNEWRKKVASAPGSTGDAFTSFVELLKNVQNR